MQGLKEETVFFGQVSCGWSTGLGVHWSTACVLTDGAHWCSPQGLQAAPPPLRSRTSVPTSPGGLSWGAPLRQRRPRELPAQHTRLGSVTRALEDLGVPTQPPRDAPTSRVSRRGSCHPSRLLRFLKTLGLRQ